MNSIETLTAFFGWCTVINLGVLVLAFLFFGVFHEAAGKLMAKSSGITNEEAKVTFFHFFQQYRLAFFVLNLVPYIALRIMA